jgi:hypothetical protein
MANHFGGRLKTRISALHHPWQRPSKIKASLSKHKNLKSPFQKEKIKSISLFP